MSVSDNCAPCGQGFLVSQSVSYFTVPPRAHPSAGSSSGAFLVTSKSTYTVVPGVRRGFMFVTFVDPYMVHVPCLCVWVFSFCRFDRQYGYCLFACRVSHDKVRGGTSV